MDAFLRTRFSTSEGASAHASGSGQPSTGPVISEGGASASSGVPKSPPVGAASSRTPPPITFSHTPEHTAEFSTTLNKAKPGAIRVEISESDQWKPGDVAILQNQEARTVRHIGSLVFACPIQNTYDDGD